MPFDNTNRGVLFTNDRKTDEKHSDYQGELNVDGKTFWLNAWVKTSKNGKQFLSVSIKPKTAAKWQQKQIDDQIPF